MKLLEIHNLTLRVPGVERPILEKVSFNLDALERIALIGANGSGKSSLVKCLVGQMTASSGEILLAGKAISSYTPEKRRNLIRILGQDSSRYVFLDLTVQENMQLAARFAGVSCFSSAFLEQIRPGLSKHLKKRAAFLSGGERQALALAMILIKPPELLILDEHTAAIDIVNAQHIVEATERLAQASITITHRLNEISSSTARVLKLEAGCLS